MRINLGLGSTRLLLSAAALSGATLLVAVGCGGGDSSPGGSGGKGGSSGDTGGDTSTGGTGKGGTSSNGGSATTGGSGGEAGAIAEGGAAGEGTVEPPAKDHSAVSFVAGGAISKSKNFTLIGSIGESIGGTGKSAKSLKHTYIPGVIAATSP
jgi:hypothetical protein